MYDDFQSVDGELVPSKIEISFSNEKIRRKLTIEYTRSEIPANLTFPFKIPTDYKKILQIQDHYFLTTLLSRV